MFTLESTTAGLLCLTAFASLFSGCTTHRGNTEGETASGVVDFSFAQDEQYDGRVTIYANGKQLPTRFTIRPEHKTSTPIPAVAFVLIPPGEVTVSGVRFPVERPFYMAVTELSLRQAALLEHGDVGMDDEDLDYYLLRRKYAFTGTENPGLKIIGLQGFELPPPIDDETLGPVLSWYFRHTDRPLIGCDNYTHAMRVLVSASWSNGVGMRLPTLAEWNYAARAGSTTAYWWGDSFKDSPENLGPGGDLNALRSLWPVHKGTPNPFGLLNMVGNASELIMPTLDEWQRIQNHPEGEARYRAIGPQIALSAGGSVVLSEAAGAGSAIHLGHQIHRRAIVVNSSDRTWFQCVGIRPVIDVPIASEQLSYPASD